MKIKVYLIKDSNQGNVKLHKLMSITERRKEKVENYTSSFGNETIKKNCILAALHVMTYLVSVTG